ncbi:MAG: glycosyltransferase family 9 protein [Isosphaeraceae bacterium]
MSVFDHGGMPPRRIAVLRALQLGDLLCAMPAFRAIRRALPESEITLIGLPWARAFTRRFREYVDDFIEFPGYPGLPEREPDLARLPIFLGRVRGSRFDVALQMHGCGTVTNPLVAHFGARRTAGFFEEGRSCPDPARYLAYPDHGLEVDRLLSLVEFLGIPPRGHDLEFPLHDEDFAELAAIAAVKSLSLGRFACIHVGASTPLRRWPVENFAQVARHLSLRGLCVVLTGTCDEVSLTQAVAREVPGRVVDLAGQTSLGALGALFRRACLLVSNDTGVSHMADALRLPSVIISTGNNPARWAPRDHRRHRVLCRASGVTPGEVIHEAEELLGGRSGAIEQAARHVDPPVAVDSIPNLQPNGEAIR